MFSSSFLPLSRGPLHCDYKESFDKDVNKSDECSELSVTENVVNNCTGFKECNISASNFHNQSSDCARSKVFLKTIFVCVEMVVLKLGLVDRYLNTESTAKEALDTHSELVDRALDVETEDVFNISGDTIERFLRYSKIHTSNLTIEDFTEQLDILPLKQNIINTSEEPANAIVIVIGGFLVTVLSITLVILLILLSTLFTKERRLQQNHLSRSQHDLYTIPEPDLFNRPN